MEFSPVTSWLRYNPFRKKRPPDPLWRRASSPMNCPMIVPGMGQIQLQRVYGEVGTYLPAAPWAGAPPLCSALRVSPPGRDALLLWARKEHPRASPLKAPRLWGLSASSPANGSPKNRPGEDVSWSLLWAFSMYFLPKTPKIKLGFPPVIRGKETPHGTRE